MRIKNRWKLKGSEQPRIRVVESPLSVLRERWSIWCDAPAMWVCNWLWQKALSQLHLGRKTLCFFGYSGFQGRRSTSRMFISAVPWVDLESCFKKARRTMARVQFAVPNLEIRISCKNHKNLHVWSSVEKSAVDAARMLVHLVRRSCCAGLQPAGLGQNSLAGLRAKHKWYREAAAMRDCSWRLLRVVPSSYSHFQLSKLLPRRVPGTVW